MKKKRNYCFINHRKCFWHSISMADANSTGKILVGRWRDFDGNAICPLLATTNVPLAVLQCREVNAGGPTRATTSKR